MTAKIFATKPAAESFARSIGQVGFAHHTPRGFIFVILHNGTQWGLVDETTMTHLSGW
jgi:hypothetical protein